MVRTFRIALFALATLTGAAVVGVMPAPAAFATVPISPTSPTYVARLKGTNAFIAFVKGSGEARAYVCDADAVSAWFGGPTTSGSFSSTSESFSLHATLTETRVAGAVTFPNGKRHAFTALRAPNTGKAGLYRGQTTINGLTYTGGWIVLPNGDVRGLVEQDNIVVPFTPIGSGIIAILIGRRSVQLNRVGVLTITDGTSNTIL